MSVSQNAGMAGFTIVPAPNGGWLLSENRQEQFEAMRTIGAYSNTKDMLAALTDMLTDGDGVASEGGGQ